MSNIIVNGTLILNGNSTCNGDTEITPNGMIIPVPDSETMKTYFSVPSQTYITANGESRSITTTTGDIIVDGAINGDGQGFESNRGPGCNSNLVDNLGFPIQGYGATHAGQGAVFLPTGQIYIFEEEFVLRQGDVNSKFVKLLGRPITLANVTLSVIGGPPQEYNLDFYVKGNDLKWDNKALEELLEAGDTLRVLYEGDTSPIVPDPRSPYGNHETPVSVGSGSGYYHDPVWYLGEETKGGSAVKLIARSGTVYIDGVITMDGQVGDHAGGASGGSVWVIGWNVTGTGSISADGGNSTLETGGGGGGGYISIWHERLNDFSGSMTVDGKHGGTDGKLFFKKIEPILEEKFTGKIWNTRWWADATGDVVLDNDVYFNSPQDDYTLPTLQSDFSLSGKNILADMDFIPGSDQVNWFESYFMLYADDLNYAGVERRNNNIFGVYSTGGTESRTAIPFDYTNVTFRISKTDSTFSFQFYDSTSVPQTIFSQVVPELANKRFNIRSGIQKPALSDASHIVEYFKLTAADQANRYLTLSTTPTDENVAMEVVHATSQYYGLDFYVDQDKLKWDSAGLSNQFVNQLSILVIDHIVLDSLNESEKRVFLSAVPEDPFNVSFTVVGGSSQTYGEDFYIPYAQNWVSWAGLALDGLLSAGDEIRLEYVWRSGVTTPIEQIIIPGDEMRVQYVGDTTNNGISATFDNLRIYEGTLFDTETKEPVIYVDPVNGADWSSGRQLSPMQNLFVATAWAKKGGTVVLYDGTYSPTSVARKNLTLQGAYGATSLITTDNVQDTTGSGWENNSLSFYGAQGIVKNVSLKGSENGIIVENSPNFEITGNDVFGATLGAGSGIKFVNCDPIINRNRVHDLDKGIDFTNCPDALVYSNIITDNNEALYATDSTKLIIQSNTMDENGTAIVFDNSSSGVISSNNLTYNDIGIDISSDSSPVTSTNNNFYATGVVYNDRIPDRDTSNFATDPLYVARGDRDYHLNQTSPDIGTGDSTYDSLFVDFDGASTSDSSADIGALRFVDGTHETGDYYVASHGDDFLNFGNRLSPYRTLDKAMRVADSTVVIDGGHYDSYYLSLRSQNIDMNQLTVFTVELNYILTYMTLNQNNIDEKSINLPGFISVSDSSKVVISMVDGGPQEYGVDYRVQYGRILWDGLALEPLLSSGDTLRVMFTGSLSPKVLNTVTLSSHFSNYSMDKAIFVSPNGSDATNLGGDGTNTGGTGTYDLPYRTVSRALSDSSTGDNIVLMPGEYPLFDGLDDRVLVPNVDRTSIPYQGFDQQYIEDHFAPKDFRKWNDVESDPIDWDFTYAGDSTVVSGGGFLSLTFDGTNAARADSIFSVTNNFEVFADVRNAINPINFSVTSPDQTVYSSYDNTVVTGGAMTGGTDYYCWGIADVPPPVQDRLVTEYIPITSTMISNKYAPLSFIPEESDATNIAVNVVGGVAQNYWDDFYVEDTHVKWEGLGLDGEFVPGDMIRVIYKDRSLSNPVRIAMSLNGDRFTVRFFDTRWRTLFRRDMVGSYKGPWTVSFSVDEPNALNHGGIIHGKGFASKFLAVGDAVEGSSQVKDFRAKTARRTVVFYKDRT